MRNIEWACLSYNMQSSSMFITSYHAIVNNSILIIIPGEFWFFFFAAKLMSRGNIWSVASHINSWRQLPPIFLVFHVKIMWTSPNCGCCYPLSEERLQSEVFVFSWTPNNKRTCLSNMSPVVRLLLNRFFIGAMSAYSSAIDCFQTIIYKRFQCIDVSRKWTSPWCEQREVM